MNCNKAPMPRDISYGKEQWPLKSQTKVRHGISRSKFTPWDYGILLCEDSTCPAVKPANRVIKNKILLQWNRLLTREFDKAGLKYPIDLLRASAVAG